MRVVLNFDRCQSDGMCVAVAREPRRSEGKVAKAVGPEQSIDIEG